MNFTQSIFFVLIIATFFSCKTTSEIKDGSLAFELHKYELAKKLLNQEIGTANSSTKLTKIIELAKSYRFSNDAENAALWYQKGIEAGGAVDLYYEKGLMLKQTENYAEAIEVFEKYKVISNDKIRALSEISICKKAIEEFERPNNMSVENLTKINSSKADFSPTIYKNKTLIFTSTRDNATGSFIHPWNGEKNSDLFQVDLKTSKVSKIDSTINTAFPEANITFNKDFSVGYFTRCGFSEDADINGYCKIFKIEKDGDSWYEPEQIKIFDDTVNVGQPFLAPDGKRLYFTTDAPAGYGGRDIFFVDIAEDGRIGFPINAGYSINTDKDERFPTMDSKGNLYFSSNGRTGYGGLDIFKAEPENRGFDNAIHLPYPINSGADDFGLIYTKEFDGKETNGLIEEAYFTSARTGGKGNDDIYQYKKELFNTFKLELLAQERSYEDPEDDASKYLGMIALKDANVVLINQSTNEKVNEVSDQDGMTYFPLTVETDYKILVSKKDYFNKSIEITTKNFKDLETIEITLADSVELKKIFPQKEIVIENIYYDLNKANLREESKVSLDKLVSFFEENNDLTIEIGSHTDSRGSDDYNQELSQRRAQSVVDYFLAKGIPSRQLIAKGYGENKILNRCLNDVECSEDEHQKNRRTSFRVVSSDGVLESN